MFTILYVYTDLTSEYETIDSIVDALTACANHLNNPDCFSVTMWDDKERMIIFDYERW